MNRLRQRKSKPWASCVVLPASLALIISSGCNSGVHTSRADRRTLLGIAVLPMGNPKRQTLDDVENALEQTFKLSVIELKGVDMLKSAYYSPRSRYRAEKIMVSAPKVGLSKVIVVTDKDISTPAHGHEDYGIMGLGQLGGANCVVSSFRARRQIGKTAVHEIGHTLGLPHCPDAKCIMVDGKGKGLMPDSSSKFCAKCTWKIRQWLN